MGRSHDQRIAVVAVAATEALVVRDVARALFEVRHEPAPFENLGQHVRRLFARQVDPTELSDAVITKFEEHLVVEFLGPAQTHRGIDRLVAFDVEISNEFSKEEPS